MLSNVISGYCATSKKSALRRWSSRPSLSVEIEDASTAALAWSEPIPSATVTVPETSRNVPETVEMPRWRTLNSIRECAASMAYVPGAIEGASTSVASAVAGAASVVSAVSAPQAARPSARAPARRVRESMGGGGG